MALGGFFGGVAGGAAVSVIIRAVDEFSGVINSATNKFGTLGRIAGTTAQAFIGFGTAAAGALALVGGAALKSAANYEQQRIAFETMLGSADKARELLEDVTQFAKTTPFEIPGVVDATKRLLAYGSTQEEVLDELKVLGDISAGVGTDKLPQLILAFGQVRAQGKL